MTEVTEAMLNAGWAHVDRHLVDGNDDALCSLYLAMEAARIPAPAPDVERAEAVMAIVHDYCDDWPDNVWREMSERVADALTDHTTKDDE